MAQTRILMVEDESIVAMDIQHRLESMGYQIAGWIAAGDQVAAEIERTRPDLVLMDIRLQGVTDGIQAAQVILRQFSIPVVFLTAYADEDTLRLAKATEPFGFVLKPCNDAELRTAIEIALYKFRTQAELAEERNLLRTLIDACPDSIYIKDGSGHFIIGNQALATRIGVRHPDELIGKTDFDFYPQECAARFRDDEQQVLTTSQPLMNLEQSYVDAAGNVRWLLTSKALFCNRAGQVIGLVGAGRDITERKRQQAEQERLDAGLRETQKLESIGVMAAGIAHDFNNLLTSIQGNVELAMLNQLPSAAVNFLKIVSLTCRRAAELIQQLQVYAGKSPCRMQPVGLSELILEMIPLVRPLLGRQADLQLQLDEHLPSVEADATQIRQVIMNLVSNAAEALGEKPGVIRLETRRLSGVAPSVSSVDCPTSLPGGDYACILVSDTGCGMDAAARARIFEPFFTTKFIGRGLGLSVVLGIVRNHHGGIRVESAPGQGTRLQVFLPYR